MIVICIDKQPTHIGHSQDVPGRPERTLGAVGGQLAALPNGGFEIILRTWSELCGNTLQGSRG